MVSQFTAFVPIHTPAPMPINIIVNFKVCGTINRPLNHVTLWLPITLWAQELIPKNINRWNVYSHSGQQASSISNLSLQTSNHCHNQQNLWLAHLSPIYYPPKIVSFASKWRQIPAGKFCKTHVSGSCAILCFLTFISRLFFIDFLSRNIDFMERYQKSKVLICTHQKCFKAGSVFKVSKAANGMKTVLAYKLHTANVTYLFQ